MEKLHTHFYKEYKKKLDLIMEHNPFVTSNNIKKNYKEAINFLTKYHFTKCTDYNNILSTLKFSIKKKYKSNLLPYLTSAIFKTRELKSIKKEEIFKIVKSSGTTGQKQSSIFLNKENAFSQIKVLSHLFQNFFNEKTRLPMLIIDSKKTISNKKNYSARTAGILGFSNFGTDITYALDENMNVDIKLIKRFLHKNKNKKKIIYGFTYIIWSLFIEKINNKKISIDLSNSILIHGGGWKKLSEKKISNKIFKEKIKKTIKISNVFNYYGLIEQAGSIFFECENNFFHTSNYSNIIIRDKEFNVKNKGIIQLQSLLPVSYPGHNLLTEDLGEIFGKDNCKCGRSGIFFKIYGRALKSEIKGCSDTLIL